jgi:protoporphyrinogen oxidase
MIDDFFTPFFSGIFLENKLETSSRMFEFVYKMFGEGHATLPKGGIEEIPKQLLNKLKNTTFKYKTQVSSVIDGEIELYKGQKIKSDFTIITTEPSKLIKNLKNQSTEWQSCDTLYFETENRTIRKPIIGLITKHNSLINNIFYHTSLETSLKPDKELLSVTVVDNQNLSGKMLIDCVQKELKQNCGIITSKFIKHYRIPMSLPKLKELQYEMTPSETCLSESIYLAGDLQLNGSLNAAMIAGERAAQGVIESLKK